MPQQQGFQANRNGATVEADIRQRLIAHGYTPMTTRQAPTWPTPYFIAQYRGAFLSLYLTPLRLDFFLVHPQKHPNGLILESKYQETGGSADEKLVYTVLSLKQAGIPTILLIQGAGYRTQAVQWCRRQADALFRVMDWNEFIAALNRGHL